VVHHPAGRFTDVLPIREFDRKNRRNTILGGESMEPSETEAKRTELQGNAHVMIEFKAKPPGGQWQDFGRKVHVARHILEQMSSLTLDLAMIHFVVQLITGYERYEISGFRIKKAE
jgi:hypothetical protein